MKYDLEERTVKFAENIIAIVRQLKITPVNKRIIDQIIGSSGSIGANYCEANGSESKKDFIHKIRIAIKERLREAYQECGELYLIFAKILNSCKPAKT